MVNPKFNTEREIIKHVVRTSVFLVILILLQWNMNLLRGYFFGLVISILLFIHTLSTTKKALRMSEKGIKVYMMGRYILHYVINGCALAVAFLREDLSFPGAIVGLLTIKIGLITWAAWNTLVSLIKSKFKESR